MEANVREITINGKSYVEKCDETTETKMAERGKDNQQYVICRTRSAGVHAGWLECKKGMEVDLTDARRLWYWDGAASLSELAVHGVKRPENCKFPCEVPRITLTEAIEIIPCTEEARISITGVKVWKA